MKPIPNTDEWLPRKDTSETLKDIFYKRCIHAESIIKNKAKQEQEFNIDNFDSGLGIEDIIREEFSNILPDRYFVTKGVINDRNGFTAGDQDLIIFNKFWFPYLKSGATKESRRLHFPIEGVYAIGEIKQTLNFDNLDKAFEKLVISKRLERPKTGRTRIVENRELDDCKHGFTNPLYSFILAINLDESISVDEIFLRFFEINKNLRRTDIINCLCILQKATITWAYFDDYSEELKPYSFSNYIENAYEPILPILSEVNEKKKSSLYDLIIHLLAHLYNTILGGEDLALAYGNSYSGIKVPPKDKFLINPK